MNFALTPPEQGRTAAFDEAVAWLASTPTDQRPRPIIPAMCERFGLSPKKVCEVIRDAALTAKLVESAG